MIKYRARNKRGMFKLIKNPYENKNMPQSVKWKFGKKTMKSINNFSLFSRLCDFDRNSCDVMIIFPVCHCLSYCVFRILKRETEKKITTAKDKRRRKTKWQKTITKHTHTGHRQLRGCMQLESTEEKSLWKSKCLCASMFSIPALERWRGNANGREKTIVLQNTFGFHF